MGGSKVEIIYQDNRKCGVSRRCGEMWFLSCLVLGSLFFFCGAAYVVAIYTDFSSAAYAWQNVALLFSAIVFCIAAIYLAVRIGFYKENYQTILKDNYQRVAQGDASGGCCEYFFTGNAILVTSYLLLIGTAPIILYPLPFGQFIILIILLFMLLFLVIAAMPCCLAQNAGRGSVDFDNGEYCEGGCCCSCCVTKEQKRPCSSDVLHQLLSITIVGVVLTIIATVNLMSRFYYPGAWLFWFAALFTTVGFSCFWEFSMPTPLDEAEQDEAAAIASSLRDEERTKLV
jgi:hypothetical protein